MAFTTKSMNKTAKEEAPKGEMRLDDKGRGYWYSFKKDKKKTEEPKVEEPKVETVQAPRRRTK